jgi:predicted transcriptional regulator
VDLIRSYSKRLNLADDLVRAVQQIKRAQERTNNGLAHEALSVRSTAKCDRLW